MASWLTLWRVESWPMVWCAVGLIIADLAAGIAIGWYIRGSSAMFIERRAHARQALNGLKRLHDLTNDVARRVGNHLTRVEEISRELVTLRADCSGPKDRAVIDAVTQIVVVNEELTEELAKAKIKLQEQAETIEAQTEAALTDLVTGLPNRKCFDDELARRFAQWQCQDTPLSIVLVDVDNLQELHVEHGQQAADEVLGRVATLLNDTVRTMDLLARYSHDQFAILLPGTSLAEAKDAAARVRAAVAQHEFFVGDVPLKLSVSEGVAEVVPGDDVRSLVARSKKALGASHTAGGNCAFSNEGGRCEAILPAAAAAEQTEADELAAERDLLRTLGRVDLAAADAYTDPLTGLLNRRGFFEALRTCLAEHRITKQPLCLLLVDVDHLQTLNEARGQLVGDVVLRAVTQILRAGTRSGIDVGGRYEGPKLAMVLAETGLADGLLFAERVRRAIGAVKLRADGQELSVTVSVGVAAQVRGGDAVSLIKAAENALRAAKSSGRNCTHFFDGRRTQPVAAMAYAG